MGRLVNKKCQHCAMLSVEDAIALHGEQGDGCWNPKTCHRRRSHYRHRDDTNRIRRRVRKMAKAGLTGTDLTNPEAVPIIEVTITPPPAVLSAVLVLYRQHKDAPVHAIAAEIWQGDQKKVDVKPVHCMGMRGNDVTAYLQEILNQLRQQFGINRFEDVIKEVPVERCPLLPCPFKMN